MLTPEIKAACERFAVNVYHLNDYFCEYRSNESLMEHFFLKADRPHRYLTSDEHIAVITWYALMRNAAAAGLPFKPLVLGMYDMVVFDEQPLSHKSFLDGLLKKKALLTNCTDGVLKEVRYLTRTVGDGLAFLPVTVGNRPAGVCAAQHTIPGVTFDCYGPYHGMLADVAVGTEFTIELIL